MVGRRDLYLFGSWGDGPVGLKASRQWDDYGNADADTDNEYGESNPWPCDQVSREIWIKMYGSETRHCPMIFAILFVQVKAVFGSFSWFVHDSSFTMVNCRKCWTLSIRQSPRNMTSPHFLFLLNVGSIIAAPSVIRMSLKYIWFRVSSRNHMQCAAAGRLSQQQLCLLCSARSSSTKACSLLL